jgi:hypothetical protein
MTSSLALCRRWFLLLMALVSLTCVTRANDLEPRVAHVTALYKRYAWELIDWDGPTRPLAAQSRRELERWFTLELAYAIAADHRCVELSHEICKLDFAILWGSQDPDVTEVQVRSLDPATVRVLLKASGRSASAPTVHVDARMVRTAQGWRIADLAYSDSGVSLKQLLTAPSPR